VSEKVTGKRKEKAGKKERHKNVRQTDEEGDLSGWMDLHGKRES
jgi:hypothetical protein